jgi:ribonuclease PH
MNVVMTGAGKLIEVQATAEKVPFERSAFDQLLDLAEAGVRRITDEQMQVVARSYVAGQS